MADKTCVTCGDTKPLSEFHPNKTSRMGVRPDCKICRAEANRRFYEKNRGAIRRRQNERRDPEKERIRQARWRRQSPGKAAAKTKRYHAAKLKRTPSWADLGAITRFYEATPEGHHVDHIIPLQGGAVSGLHVLDNLQYLPASENRAKGNRTWPTS